MRKPRVELLMASSEIGLGVALLIRSFWYLSPWASPWLGLLALVGSTVAVWELAFGCKRVWHWLKKVKLE